MAGATLLAAAGCSTARHGGVRHRQTVPIYPPVLRSASIEGVVRFSVRVDPSGRPDPGTFRVHASDHPLFTLAARRAAASWAWKRTASMRLARRAAMATHAVHWRFLPPTDDTAAASCPPNSGAATFVCAPASRPPARAVPGVIGVASARVISPRGHRSVTSRDSALAELASSRARWQSIRPRAYRYSLRRQGGWQARRTQRVAVVDGRARPAGPTADSLFAWAERAIRDTTLEIVVVSYHPRWAVPAFVGVDRGVMSTDDDSELWVDDFVAAPAPRRPLRRAQR